MLRLPLRLASIFMAMVLTGFSLMNHAIIGFVVFGLLVVACTIDAAVTWNEFLNNRS